VGQFTACSSLWCSVKLPAVWKNFFGTIGAQAHGSEVEALAGLGHLAAALEVLTRRRAVEFDDRFAVQLPDPTIVERDQPHAPTSSRWSQRAPYRCWTLAGPFSEERFQLYGRCRPGTSAEVTLPSGSTLTLGPGAHQL
jgi:hypothetical protein